MYSLGEYERYSFDYVNNKINELLHKKNKRLNIENEAVIKRAIMASGDFDYLDTLHTSPHFSAVGMNAVKDMAHLITDNPALFYTMNYKKFLEYGGQLHCLSEKNNAECDLANSGKIYSTLSIDEVFKLSKPLIFAVCSDCCALKAIYKRAKTNAEEKKLIKLIIAAPTAFGSGCEIKAEVKQTGIPYAVTIGSKGGVTTAAAICNAFLWDC